MLAGGSLGLLSMMLAGRVVGFVPGCGTGIFAFILALVLSHPIDGIPSIAYLARNLHGLATVAALRSQVGLFTLLLQAKPEDGVLQAEEIYGTQAGTNQTDGADQWVLLPGGFPNANETGLLPQPSPFGREPQKNT